MIGREVFRALDWIDARHSLFANLVIVLQGTWRLGCLIVGIASSLTPVVKCCINKHKFIEIVREAEGDEDSSN